MSLDDSSSIAECQTDECQIIHSSTNTSSPIINLPSPSIADSPSGVNEFTTERIYRLLKNDPTNFKVVKNVKNNSASICWKMFGFPSKKSPADGEFEPIPGFVSCESCFQTYAFTSTSGTRICILLCV